MFFIFVVYFRLTLIWVFWENSGLLDVIKLSILETFRKKMHFSKVLVFGQAVFGTLVPDRVNEWAFNPKCPTEEAKQNCDKSCMDINVVCTIACGGNYDCISNCTRSYYTCIEDCPCNKHCFQGCPCPEENEFCIPEVELECDEEFDYEFNQCHDEMQAGMFDCVAARV